MKICVSHHDACECLEAEREKKMKELRADFHRLLAVLTEVHEFLRKTDTAEDCSCKSEGVGCWRHGVEKKVRNALVVGK